MWDETPKQALKWMQKAVPLMLQLDISPTPYNYGIWYEYVSNRNKALNQLVDETLRKLGNIPNFLSRDFFHEFILPNEFHQNNKNQKNIEQVANQLEMSSIEMGDSLSDLNAVISKSRTALQHSDSQQQLHKVISYLDRGSRKALEVSQKFQSDLLDAQKDIQQLKLELETLKKSLDIDPLTKLENKTAFERHLYEHQPEAEDDISLLILDIDYLGRINKDYGQRAGTSLIRYVGALLETMQLENSHIARLEGGTFGIMLYESTSGDAHDYAEHLRYEISQQKIRHKQSKETIPQVTVSIGIATLVGKESIENLFARATTQLKRAKQQGKNCFCFL
ncbi:GGDEF domain-containing protein [Marinomonas spartinae]|uniref:GGDEF domain-containing protein n=1 Tax=Marinomonas spartinae TaxID=1792290 RepID=UPI0018F23E78|nr:GGDEF domain-containing protein [Marinomonas spartinae]MBJ7554041.1 GGDEF domain-containing protein [Marinomonas spartinae]